MQQKIRETEIKDAFRLYKYIILHYPSTALLESLGNRESDVAQYSIIGINAEKKLFERQHRYFVKSYYQDSEIETDNWQSVLDDWCAKPGKTNTPLQTGVIGYIGYENLRFFEKINSKIKNASGFPELCLVKYNFLYIMDHITGKAYWVYCGDFEKIIETIEREYNVFIVKSSQRSFYTLGDTEKDFDVQDYLDSVSDCIHRIRMGDILQANITMRFHGRFVGQPFELYESLRISTPNPFFAYFDFEDPLISTSPECFLHIAGGIIDSRPIKGTVRTYVDGKDQKDFLENNKKNCSENLMITDLIRNDIGRICKIGSVEVPVLCGTKKFNQLYHLETIVKGKLIDGIKFSEILRANFPGGSITGAPKVKAMEIIDELEFTERGPYCGAIGFFGCEGFVSTSIGIRLIYFHGDTYYLHAGGGIVVNSDPQNEYEELLLKVEPLIGTLKSFNILSEQRETLNEIDSELLVLLGRRMSVVKEVSEIKRDYHIPIEQKDRMNEIFERIKRLNKDLGLNLSEQFIVNIYFLILNESMKLEKFD